MTHQLNPCKTPTEHSFHVWFQVDIFKVHLSLPSLGPLECFMTEKPPSLASDYVFPPSFSISACLCLCVCLCVLLCSRRAFFGNKRCWGGAMGMWISTLVMSFIYLKSSLCLVFFPLQLSQSHSLSHSGHFSHMHLRVWTCTLLTYISPSSILFNPNLSHSTLNKDATTWSFFRSDSLTLQSQKQEDVMLLPADSHCDKHIPHCCFLKCCPSVPRLCIRPINCLNTAHAILCLCIFRCQIWCLPRYDTLATTCFPA